MELSNQNYPYAEYSEATKAPLMISDQKPLKIPQQIKNLELLVSQIQSIESLEEKLKYLKMQPAAAQFYQAFPKLASIVNKLPLHGQYVVTAVLSIGQGPIVFDQWNSLKDPEGALDKLVEDLLEIEKFYDTIGGIPGYHLTILKLIANEPFEVTKTQVTYEKPEGLDICSGGSEVKEKVHWGIEALRHLGEMYPVGGAGDRLSLQDNATGEYLPAAQLHFRGCTLLEGLIRDLQGWEWLYYKLFGKQLMTPIAMMTSDEKDNHRRLTELCEEKEWFGRTRDSFCLFRQPLVPMVTEEGEWVMADVLRMYMKPGGHGAIWKVAADRNVFSWFKAQNRSKVIVRQINNPVAATDNGLFVLAGIGVHERKAFGFASCHRLLRTPEGMDVLKETQDEDGYEYCITNIEYTEFKRCGIEDVPDHPGSAYSRFPSNTNILYADLNDVEATVKRCPLPGILLNMKNRVAIRGGKGEKLSGRLESIMQNIAECMADNSEVKLTKEECKDLRTYLTYNDRRKTISVVKQLHEEGKTIVGTPEGCLYDITSNYWDLLAHHCGFEMPPLQSEEEFLAQGPRFIVHLHPAMGMLYSVVCQKLRKGRMAIGSELSLEVAEADISHLELEGSLIVESEDVMGRKDQRGVIVYDSENCGKCTLANVKVTNRGYGSASVAEVWQNQVQREEALRITLQGNGEFYAEGVTLTGDMHFVVPKGHRLVVYPQGREIAWHFEKIAHASWKWDYTFDEGNNICLEKVKSTR